MLFWSTRKWYSYWNFKFRAFWSLLFLGFISNLEATPEFFFPKAHSTIVSGAVWSSYERLIFIVFQQYFQSKWFFGLHSFGQVCQRVWFNVTTDPTKLFGSCFLSVGKAFVNGYFLQRYESWAIEMFLAQGQTYL